MTPCMHLCIGLQVIRHEMCVYTYGHVIFIFNGCFLFVGYMCPPPGVHTDPAAQGSVSFAATYFMPCVLRLC